MQTMLLSRHRVGKLISFPPVDDYRKDGIGLEAFDQDALCSIMKSMAMMKSTLIL